MADVLAEWGKRHPRLYGEARLGRLERRLIRERVQRVTTEGGGDCQFHAIVAAIGRTDPEREVSVELLRHQAAAWLECRVDDDDIVPVRIGFLDTANGAGREDLSEDEIREEFLAECASLGQLGGKWGDEFSLMALADVHKMRVRVISDSLSATPDGDADVIIEPEEATIDVTLVLSGGERAQMHYESIEPRTAPAEPDEPDEPDEETLQRARNDVQSTLGAMLRGRADADQIIERTAMDVALCRMMASAHAVGDDEPQSPPILAATGKRAAQFHASPTYAESDAQHEQSPGGTVRELHTGRACRPRRRAKSRGNLFAPLADGFVEDKDEDAHEDEDEHEDEGEGEEEGEEEKEGEGAEVAHVRAKFGSIKMTDWRREILDHCRQTHKPATPSPAPAVEVSDDSLESRARRFVGPAIAGSAKAMYDANAKIRGVLDVHFEANLSPVLEEFVLDAEQWLADGDNMSKAKDAMLTFLDRCECFPLVGFKDAFDPKDASDESIKSFLREVARVPGWVSGADTPIQTLSGDIIGAQRRDTQDASVAGHLADTSTWRHTYFSTTHVPAFFVEQFYDVGETLGDDKSGALELMEHLRTLSNWLKSREHRDSRGDLKARLYAEPVNAYVWLVRSDEGAYVGESERWFSTRLGEHRNYLISDGDNAQQAHIRARDNTLVRYVDFTVSGNPSKCWEPIVDANVRFHAITHPTRRRMGRLLSAFVAFVLEYRATHKSNKPKYVRMHALAALGAFDGMFVEIVWTYFLKTWIELGSTWALNRATPGIRIAGHRKVPVVSMADTAGFATNPWVLRCYGEDTDRAATAVRTMSSIVLARHETIFADSTVSPDLVNRLLVFFTQNFWSAFVDLLAGAEAVSNGNGSGAQPSSRSLTARFFGGDEKACDIEDGAILSLFRDLLRFDANGGHARALIDSLGNKEFLTAFLGEACRSQPDRLEAALEIWFRDAEIILPSKAVYMELYRITKMHTKTSQYGDALSGRLVAHWIRYPQALRSLLVLIHSAEGTLSPEEARSVARVETASARESDAINARQLRELLRGGLSAPITWFITFWRSRMESTDKKVDVAKFSKENFAAAYSDVDARAGKQLNMRRLIFGVLLAAANGDTYDAKYASIAEKYVLRPEVGASTEATLNAQAKALLENAKRLIDEHGETRSGDLMWSDLEDAAIAFALAALAEKGGGAGAFQVDRTTALRTENMRYVWEVVLPYVRSARTSEALCARWRKVLSKKTENNSISYADALERLKSETAKYEDIEPKERDKKATLDAQAKALLENAKRLIDEHGETRSGDLMWSDLEDAVIAFALAALAEKGGGAGAFQVDRTTWLGTENMRYVWEVVLPYVRSARTLEALFARWRRLLSKKTENAHISYADALERLKSEMADLLPPNRSLESVL